MLIAYAAGNGVRAAYMHEERVSNKHIPQPLQYNHSKCLAYLFTWLYRIAGKFCGKLNLADRWTARATAKISYSHIYVWRPHTKLPNLNPPIRLRWQFGSQPQNLIPANISRYMVSCLLHPVCANGMDYAHKCLNVVKLFMPNCKYDNIMVTACM